MAAQKILVVDDMKINLTVIANGTTNVYSTGTTTIDLNALKSGTTSSVTAQNAILVFTCIIPAVLLILVGCLIYKYPLTDERLDEINKEIEERNK